MISLHDILFYYKNNKTWSEEYSVIYNLMRDFVASSARGDRRRRIQNTPIYSINDCGILERLVYSDGHVQYVAGQDYPREMGILRDIFDR